MKSTRKAFTLVELLVVIAILAILSSVAVVGYTSFIDKANDSNAESELHQIKSYITADLMADGEWEYTDENGQKVIVSKKSTGLVVLEGNIDLATAINNCPEFDGLGEFVVEGANLKYTSSNGKGTAIWENIVYVCDHASTEVVPGTPATCMELNVKIVVLY